MTKVAVFVTTKTKPGRRDEVRVLWEKHLKQRAAANAAQETYFFCYDNRDPDTFHLFEVYADPSALAANATADWFAAYLSEVGPLIEETAFHEATPIWVKA
jgi:quinol monooxygenase YgiN